MCATILPGDEKEWTYHKGVQDGKEHYHENLGVDGSGLDFVSGVRPRALKTLFRQEIPLTPL